MIASRQERIVLTVSHCVKHIAIFEKDTQQKHEKAKQSAETES